MGGLGLGLIIIAAFIGIIGLRGTYKDLPPWNSNATTNTTAYTLSDAINAAGQNLGSSIAAQTQTQTQTL